MGKQPVEIVLRQSRQQPVLAGHVDLAAFCQWTPPRGGWNGGTGPPRLDPVLVIFDPLSQKNFSRSCRKPYRRLHPDNGQKVTIVCWQTDGPFHGLSLRDQA